MLTRGGQVWREAGVLGGWTYKMQKTLSAVRAPFDPRWLCSYHYTQLPQLRYFFSRLYFIPTSTTAIRNSMPTLFGLRGERLQTAMSFAVVIPAFLAMGFSLSFLGGVVGYQPFYAQFPKINTATTTGELKKHNALIQGVTVSTLNLGAILGCFSVMYLGNKLGRRKTTFVGAVVTLVGTVLQCSAFSIAQLIVGRRK